MALPHCFTRIVLFLLVLILSISCRNLHVITSNSSLHGGIKRFQWSASVYNHKVMIIEANNDNLQETLIHTLKQLQLDDQNIILFCNSTFSSIGDDEKGILATFDELEHDVIYDKSNADQFNCVIGVASKMLMFLTGRNAEKISIGEDDSGKLFTNLDNFPEMVGYTSDMMQFYNFELSVYPCIIIGSIKSYNVLNRLLNYAPGVFNWDVHASSKWRRSIGAECSACGFYQTVKRSEMYTHKDNYTMMVTAFYIKEDTPLLEQSLHAFLDLTWDPRSRCIIIFNSLAHREHVVERVQATVRRIKPKYFFYFNSSSPETQTRAQMHLTTRKLCTDVNCMWIWNTDSRYILIQYNTLEELMTWNFSIIAPFYVSNTQKSNPQTNFWSAVDKNGFYKRSWDYFDVINRDYAGIFAVPYIGGVYLIKREVEELMSYQHPRFKDTDSDVIFANSVRNLGYLMVVKTTRVDGVIANGEVNATDPYPLLEHAADNKTPFYLNYFFRWNHLRIRDYKHTQVKPESFYPCEDVLSARVFDTPFTDYLFEKASLGNTWTQRIWNDGWDKFETLAFNDFPGLTEGWVSFSTEYLPAFLKKKFSSYVTDSDPLHSFFMRVDNKTAPVPLLEGKGVYTVLIPLTNATTHYNGTGITFDNICTFHPPLKSLLIFPSRLTHTWKPEIPSSGKMLFIVSFYE